MQAQILEQLKKMNHRLGTVEECVAQSTYTQHTQRQKLSKNSKTGYKSSNSSDSDSSDDNNEPLPSLSSIRKSAVVQKQVDSWIRQLEKTNQSPGTDTGGKIKSKGGGGGPTEVIVKNRMAWPQDAILGGVNRTRVTYDQLSMSQWVHGFCRNVLEEKSENIREKCLN